MCALVLLLSPVSSTITRDRERERERKERVGPPTRRGTRVSFCLPLSLTRGFSTKKKKVSSPSLLLSAPCGCLCFVPVAVSPFCLSSDAVVAPPPFFPPFLLCFPLFLRSLYQVNEETGEGEEERERDTETHIRTDAQRSWMSNPAVLDRRDVYVCVCWYCMLFSFLFPWLVLLMCSHYYCLSVYVCACVCVFSLSLSLPLPLLSSLISLLHDS